MFSCIEAEGIEILSPMWGARAKHIRVPVVVVLILVIYFIARLFS